MTQDEWWSQLAPNLAFEDEHGVVHRTTAQNFGAMCGNTFYAERAASTNDIRRIAGRALGKSITCFQCIEAGALDAE